MSIVTLFGDEFSPLGLFRGGAVGFFHSTSPISSMFTDAAGTIPVTAVDDYVGNRNDMTANAIAFTQSTSTARPQYKGTYLKYDLTDDAMNATIPAIASGTVVILTSKGAWFDTFTSASGAFAWGPTTYTGGPTGLFIALRQAANDYREIARFVINRSLTAAEKSQILAWAKPRGCPGEITLSADIKANAAPFRVGSGTAVTATYNTTTGEATASRVSSGDQTGISLPASAHGGSVIIVTGLKSSGADVTARNSYGGVFLGITFTSTTPTTSLAAIPTPGLSVDFVVNPTSGSSVFTISSIKKVIFP